MQEPSGCIELIRRIRVTSPVALDPTGRNRLHMHNLYDAIKTDGDDWRRLK